MATLIMGIAITGLLSALSTSMRNASRLTDYDRAALLGHQKMDELLIATKLPMGVPMEGTWDRAITGDHQMGWRAQLTAYEKPPGAGVGVPILERVELEIWWMSGDQRRNFVVEGYRRGVLLPEGPPR